MLPRAGPCFSRAAFCSGVTTSEVSSGTLFSEGCCIVLAITFWPVSVAVSQLTKAQAASGFLALAEIAKPMSGPPNMAPVWAPSSTAGKNDGTRMKSLILASPYSFDMPSRLVWVV